MPYSLFDYVPESFHTMGATRPGYPGNNWVQCKSGRWDVTNGVVAPCREDYAGGSSTMTTKNVGEECPQVMPPACKPGFEAKIKGYSPDACKTPQWFCEPSAPKCAPTISQGGCNYKLV